MHQPPSSCQPIDLRTCREDITSQHGENGILSAVFASIKTTNKVCIEFGAYDLRRDSNVYPLWARSGWHAFLIESDAARVSNLRRDYLTRSEREKAGSAEIIHATIKPDGENSLDRVLDRANCPREPDLLVIDVDGLDYHIWDSLRVCQPRVVVCEFNPTIPPNLEIVGGANGFGMGCSARALQRLGNGKGYALLTCTKVNAVFARVEFADLFVEADVLEAHFDAWAIRRAFSTYDGSIAFDGPLVFKSNVLSRAARDSGALTSGCSALSDVLTPGYVATRLGFELSQSVNLRLSSTGLRIVRFLRRKLNAHWFEPKA